MNRVLGIRAVPDGFFWAVVEGERAAPILVASDKAIFSLHPTRSLPLSLGAATVCII